jgi:hypothetical protein
MKPEETFFKFGNLRKKYQQIITFALQKLRDVSLSGFSLQIGKAH